MNIIEKENMIEPIEGELVIEIFFTINIVFLHYKKDN